LGLNRIGFPFQFLAIGIRIVYKKGLGINEGIYV
jgi:hypothetical protein